MISMPHPPPPAITTGERRPQADPLPSKRGEIGYVEGASPAEQTRTENVTLPPRHPADRDPSSSSPSAPESPSVSSENAPPSPSSITKSSSILNFLKPKNGSFGGVQLNTVLMLTVQLLILAATIVGWAISTKILVHAFPSDGSLSTNVFIHIIFVITVIGQLIFLERRIFRIRGERYSYLHPGEILPRHRNHPPSPDPGLAFAPWNRPPLPTYAAALAQSGVGTGDVEDHLIAASPPPAYGHTRGSRLVLQGYLRDSLRAQRPQSAHSVIRQTPDERPMSYASSDGYREGPDRAQRLEETLNRLESPVMSSVAR